MPSYHPSNHISRVETTGDTLTGRAGLALFAQYLSNIDLYSLLEESFGHLRRSMKGLPIWNLFL